MDESLQIKFLNYILESRNRIINPEPTKQDIYRSIHQRRFVGIYYEEDDPELEGVVLSGFRLIEPYAYGRAYRRGEKVIHPSREYIRGYILMEGETENLPFGNRKTVSLTEREVGWRLFRKDRITDWFTFDNKFSHYRQGYNPRDSQMGIIMKSLDLSYFPSGMKEVKGLYV